MCRLFLFPVLCISIIFHRYFKLRAWSSAWGTMKDGFRNEDWQWNVIWIITQNDHYKHLMSFLNKGGCNLISIHQLWSLLIPFCCFKILSEEKSKRGTIHCNFCFQQFQLIVTWLSCFCFVCVRLGRKNAIAGSIFLKQCILKFGR